MIDVIESLKDTIKRFALNSQELTADAFVNTRELTVVQTRKFFEGETVVVRNSEQGEVRKIDKIIDEKTMTLTEDLVKTWPISEGCIVEKAPGGQYVKRIYFGDPTVIPDYPAITIMGDSRDEEWWTIDSTKRKWNCTISILVEDAADEEAYKSMLLLTKTVEDALWVNRWPIFDTKYETDITVDVEDGDEVITVDDTSGLQAGQQIVIEDLDRTQQNEILQVIDEKTIKLRINSVHCFKVSEGATLLVPSRWVMWSKPESTDYGFVHKETLLKASQIKWFAEEEVCRLNPHVGPTRF